MRRKRREAVVRCFRERFRRWIQEVRVGAIARAPHPSAKLVKLRETKSVRILHDQGICVRNVEARFHNRRAHEYVEALLPKIEDDSLELGLVKLAVGDLHSCIGHELTQVRGGALNILDAVVDVEYLPLTQEFAADRGLDLSILVRANVGEHGMALLWRSREWKARGCP